MTPPRRRRIHRSRVSIPTAGEAVWRYEYQSIGELAEAAAKAAPVDPRNADAVSSQRRLQNNWSNNYTMKRLAAAAENPPAHIVEAVRQLADDLERTLPPPPVTKRRRRRANLELGTELDPTAYIQRRPDGWSIMEREPRPKNVITIGVNLAINCEKKPAHLLHRGAAAVALVDIYTRRGFSVELVGFWAARDLGTSTPMTVIKVTVKPAHAPLELGAVSFAMAEIAYFRLAIITSAIVQLPDAVTGNYGQAAPLPEADAATVDLLIPETVFDRSAALAAVAALAEKGLT